MYPNWICFYFTFIGESNDDDPDDKFKKASRHVIFHKAEDALNEVLIHIDKAQDLCNNVGSNTTTNKSKDQYVKSKEILTNESRQFVTASKLFVKRYILAKYNTYNKNML